MRSSAEQSGHVHLYLVVWVCVLYVALTQAAAADTFASGLAIFLAILGGAIVVARLLEMKRRRGAARPWALSLARWIFAGVLSPLDKDTRAIAIQRIDDLRASIAAAQAALAGGDLDQAGRALVRGHWLVGHGWRRYALEVDGGSQLLKIGKAWTRDSARLVAQLGAMLSAPHGANAPSCALCPRSENLTRCEVCGHPFCGDHLAAEEIWSGSWKEGVEAVCPLGHRFEKE